MRTALGLPSGSSAVAAGHESEDAKASGNGKQGEGRGLPRSVSGTAKAYDQVADGYAYRLALTQTFNVRLAGRTPMYLGGLGFRSDPTYGPEIAGGSVSHGATSVSSAACTKVPAAGGSCLVVTTEVTGELVTSYGNHYSQSGSLVTEVNRDGESATSVILGAVSGPSA